LFKISQKIQLSHYNINQDLLFKNLSRKLNDKNNIIKKIKHLVEENTQETSSHTNQELHNSMKYKPLLKKQSSSHLSVSINKHQGLNKKEIINKKASISNLLQWAKYNKMHLRKIHLNFSNNGYEMAKSEDKMKQGENIISIPKDLILTSNNPLINNLCETINKIEEFKNEPELICLTVALKNKLLKTKKFEDFINYLFESVKFISFPIFYSPEENLLIKGSYLYTLISAMKSEYKLEYSILSKKNLFNSEDFTEDDYLKSRIIVNSKFYNLKSNGKVVPALIPLIDLFSSKTDKSNCELVMLKNGSLQFRSTELINKRELIHMSLGRYSNYNILINYGFTMINNPIPLNVYLDLKIKNENGEKKNKEILLSKDININNSLIKLRKIVYKLSNEKNSKIKNFETPKAVDNEIESLRVFKDGLKSQIANYSTNIKEDIIRSTQTRNYNEINILNVLIEEKKVIFNINNRF